MKISRWIYVPLIIALSYIVFPYFFGRESIDVVIYWAVYGTIVGFITLYWSDSKARKNSGKDDEEIYKVRQKREVVVLLNFEKTFELCKEAIDSLNPAKIKTENLKNGVIIARTQFSWSSFGSIIQLNLKKLNENLTEIEISTRPIPRTAIVDNGEGWKLVEEISEFLKEQDAEINKKVLVDSVGILEDIYVKPFQKEKILFRR